MLMFTLANDTGHSHVDIPAPTMQIMFLPVSKERFRNE